MPMYLGWFDDTAPSRKPATKKIEEAIKAYVNRFKTHPNVVLCNEVDMCEVKGVTVRSESYIRRNNFWVGLEERRSR